MTDHNHPDPLAFGGGMFCLVWGWGETLYHVISEGAPLTFAQASNMPGFWVGCIGAITAIGGLYKIHVQQKQWEAQQADRARQWEADRQREHERYQDERHRRELEAAEARHNLANRVNTLATTSEVHDILLDKLKKENGTLRKVVAENRTWMREASSETGKVLPAEFEARAFDSDEFKTKPE